MANYNGIVFLGNIKILDYISCPCFEVTDSSFVFPNVNGQVDTFEGLSVFPEPINNYSDIVYGLAARAFLEKNTQYIVDSNEYYERDGYTLNLVTRYVYSSGRQSGSSQLYILINSDPSAVFSYRFQDYGHSNKDFESYTYSNGENVCYVKYGNEVRRAKINVLTNFNNVIQCWLAFTSNVIYPDIYGPYISSDFPSKPIDPNTPTNPYDPIGPSIPGDLPPGTFDDTSDPIPDSSLPTLSAANTGFTRIYNPTLSQVQELAKYLWTDDTVIETIWNHIKQYFEDPMQAIIGFNLVPVSVPDGGQEEFALMYIKTGVTMTVAANQFVDVDCGTLTIERYYGSALDQSPYTKITCFLPYIGQVDLNTDEVMGTTLQVKYRVDIVTGSCVAKIFVDGNCLYQYSGHCAINVPISSADFSSYVNAAISIANLGITAGASGIPMLQRSSPVTSIQETSSTTTTNSDTARNPATGRQITTGTHSQTVVTESSKEVTTTKASFSGLTPENISNTVGQIMSSKADIRHSGSFSGNSGYLGVRRPYLIIERPNICLPANYQALNGYPSMITMSLGSCQGYTQVQQVQLTGVTATNPEQAEILSLLKSGVIF